MTPEQIKRLLLLKQEQVKLKAQPAPESPAPPNQSVDRVIATTPEGGRVIERADGTRAFTSPAYSTTNPEQIARILEGAKPSEESRKSFYESAISEYPVAARAAKFLQGVPFVGEYADEAIGAMSGDDAMSAMRLLQSGMDETRPMQSAALQIAGGIVGSAPLALMAGPGLIAKAPTSVGGKMLVGSVLGAGAGGTEGFVSGYGAGNDGNRLAEALSRGYSGAKVGAAIGAATPLVSKTFAFAVERIRGRDVTEIAKQLGVSREAARVIKTALDNDDMPAVYAAMQNAKPDTMLADAGPATANLLDAAMSSGGEALRVGRTAISARAAASATIADDVLNDVLGPVRGVREIATGVRVGSQPARQAAYNGAYSAPIDYAAPKGRYLETLMERVPQSAINRANDLMRLAGEQSKQIKITFGKDGKAIAESLPDVRQWDYITRALRDVADEASAKGKLGGTTDLGRAYGDLSRTIRGTLRDIVPAYGKALDTAADAISERNAVDLGYNMLRGSMTRENVVDAMRGASSAERKAAMSGLRSYIDDTLAKVRRTMTEPNTDVRELIKVVKDMSSRDARDKITALLGKADAKKFFEAIDEAAVSVDLMDAVARSSQTAIRTATQAGVKAQTQPGAVAMLFSGRPAEASKRAVALFTGNTDEARLLREQGIYAEIAKALTSIRGQDASRATALVYKAMNGQSITDAQARLIGRVVAGGTGLTAYQAYLSGSNIR
jgi:hypothetical protein